MLDCVGLWWIVLDCVGLYGWRQIVVAGVLMVYVIVWLQRLIHVSIFFIGSFINSVRINNGIISVVILNISADCDIRQSIRNMAEILITHVYYYSSQSTFIHHIIQSIIHHIVQSIIKLYNHSSHYTIHSSLYTK